MGGAVINLQSFRRRMASACALVVVMMIALPQAALADHEDGFYTQPTFSQWPSPQYDIIIVPPNHGQIYNFETGILNGGDMGELTLENTYLAAVEDAVAAWDHAVEMFGSPKLREAWTTNAYVVGRDQIPQEALSDPEILVFTAENGYSLGTAYRAPVCISRMSKFSLLSFTYADMFNVTIHEVGHCLGLGHMGDQGGVDPLSEQKHPEHDVMNGFYGDSVGYAGNHLHCPSNLNVWGLEWVFRNPRNAIATVGGVSGKIDFPVSQYGTTCEPPPPGKEPPPYPEPPPPPVKPPSLTYYERDVDLALRRHLIAVGEVWVYGEQMACVSEVKVEIVRKRQGEWVTAKRVVADSQGRFRVRLPDRPGTYAARVTKLELGDEVCEPAASPLLRHRH